MLRSSATTAMNVSSLLKIPQKGYCLCVCVENCQVMPQSDPSKF